LRAAGSTVLLEEPGMIVFSVAEPRTKIFSKGPRVRLNANDLSPFVKQGMLQGGQAGIQKPGKQQRWLVLFLCTVPSDRYNFVYRDYVFGPLTPLWRFPAHEIPALRFDALANRYGEQ
jgi:hypothetical protein